MKILTGIDVPLRPFGGSLVYTNDVYSHLPDGIEVRFMALKPPPGEPKWWSIQDVVLLDVPKARSVEQFPEHIAQLRDSVARQIAEYQPDIIHAQHLNFGLSRNFVDLAPYIPKLGICHGTDVQAATSSGYFRGNLAHVCDGLDEIIFPNQIMADDCLALHATRTPYVLNPSGIPDRYFNNGPARKPFQPGDRLEVVYAGRLLAWKGPDIAVEAMAHTKANIHLTVIGNQDQEGFPEQMRDFVKHHGLGDRVTFLPQMPRDELVESFKKFDCMVLPSRRLEAFSLVAVEAQANGLPIIFSAEGGGLTSTAGEGGIPVHSNTPRELAGILEDLAVHPAKLETARQKGFANAEQYRLSVTRNRLFELSRELIARAGQTLPRS